MQIFQHLLMLRVLHQQNTILKRILTLCFGWINLHFLFSWKKNQPSRHARFGFVREKCNIDPTRFLDKQTHFFAWRLFPQVCMPRQGYQLTVFESTSLLKFLCSIFLLNSFVSIFPPEWVAQISLKGGLNHIKDNDKSTKCATRYNIIFDNQ